MYEVCYVSDKSLYAETLESIKFNSKENADTFIRIMKAEGYEISNFGGNYTGE